MTNLQTTNRMEIKAGAMIPKGSLRTLEGDVLTGPYRFDNYLYLRDSDVIRFSRCVERTCLVDGGYINGYLYNSSLLGVLLQDGTVRLYKMGHNLIEG